MSTPPSPAAPEHHHEPLPEGDEPPPRGTTAMGLVRWLLVAAMAIAAVAAIGSFAKSALGPGDGHAAHAQYICPMHPTIVQDRPGECPICGMALVLASQAPVVANPPEKTASAQAAKQELYVCPMHPEETSTDPKARCPKCHMRLEKVEAKGADAALYVCPMHPEETSTDPNARCPKCHMRLEKAEAQHARHEEPPDGVITIQLPPERVQQIGARSVAIERRKLNTSMRAVGTVTTDETAHAQLHTRTEGWIEKLRVAQTGKHVRKGEILAELYSPDLLAAQKEFLQALGHSSHGDLSADGRRRLELLGLGPEEIQQIESTKQPLHSVPIRSPISGHVLKKNVLQGQFVDPQMPLFEIANLSRVWVVADVPELRSSLVKVGDRGEMTLGALPGEAFTGKVTFLAPTLNLETRTLGVRLELQNPKLTLRPGMTGEVAFQGDDREVLAAPREAVIDTGQQQYVFVELSPGTYEPREVVTGLRGDRYLEIVSGVSAGQKVVTNASFLIDSESRLRAALAGASKRAAGANK